MRKNLFLTILLGLALTSRSYAAWDATKPADTDIRKQAPAQIRANWVAIALGTDAALLVTNAKISATAGIVDTKLAAISTANKVSGSALFSLGSIPVGGGQLPIANGGTGQSTATAGLTALLPSQTGSAGKALVTNGTAQSWGYPASLTISSAATGDTLYYNGTTWERFAAGPSGYYLKGAGAAAPVWTDINNISTGQNHDGSNSRKVLATNLDVTGGSATTFLRGDGTWASVASSQIFTTDGTFTAPAGITKVYLTMVGGGGGGSGINITESGGGGGGGGESCIMVPYIVVPASEYAVDVGAGGAGGGSTSDGSAGSPSSFNSWEVHGGSGGIYNYNGGAGGVGGTGGILTGNGSGATGGSQGGTGLSITGGAGGNSPNTNGGGGGGTIIAGGPNGAADGTGAAGTANTGTGGAGAGNGTGGAGGSGIVIVSW